MEASIITTYRCPMRCQMCNIWAHPSDPAAEFTPAVLKKLPKLRLANVTGGEPTEREDLANIIEVLFTKTRRIVISTSGWNTERTLALAKRFPQLGFRVSLEGLSQKNDELRGRRGGFDRGIRLLLGLRQLGVKDIGFGITVSDSNSEDMLWLYELSRNLRMQFATAAFHNSFYFHKSDNRISNENRVCTDFAELANRLLRENHPKSWLRALFNVGLINYVRGKRRMLPCEAGTENFFVDPFGEVLPCNGMEPQNWYGSMGNLKSDSTFEEIWNGPKARQIREHVAGCSRNCWMIGSVAPVMRKRLLHIAPWVAQNKARSAIGKGIPEEPCPAFNCGTGRAEEGPAQ
jgi:Fe-coproporphyrin III synthase